MMRSCTDDDVPVVGAIINEAAKRYQGAIPADCWHEPYMSRAELVSAIAAGVTFSGWEEPGALVGVMGIQPVRDVTLIRHAYVLPSHQGRGIGAALLDALAPAVQTRLLVGTWADAPWAITFYRRHGFRLIVGEERDQLLRSYWEVPSRQREVSVVLEYTGLRS